MSHSKPKIFPLGSRFYEEDMCVEMPDGMHTNIKRRVVSGSAENLLLNPGLRTCDKTWPENEFISLESGKIFHVISDPWNGPSFVLPPYL